jgi:hypothetical protein
MSNKDAKNKESETRLLGLALMIKEVYIPSMENKKEITHHMGKFMGHIQTSVLQAYGNVSINVPEIPNSMTDEEVGRKPELVAKLQAAVVSTILRKPTTQTLLFYHAYFLSIIQQTLMNLK